MSELDRLADRLDDLVAQASSLLAERSVAVPPPPPKPVDDAAERRDRSRGAGLFEEIGPAPGTKRGASERRKSAEEIEAALADLKRRMGREQGS